MHFLRNSDTFTQKKHNETRTSNGSFLIYQNSIPLTPQHVLHLFLQHDKHCVAIARVAAAADGLGNRHLRPKGNAPPPPAPLGPATPFGDVGDARTETMVPAAVLGLDGVRVASVETDVTTAPVA